MYVDYGTLRTYACKSLCIHGDSMATMCKYVCSEEQEHLHMQAIPSAKMWLMMLCA